jgi:hypothetical protein
MFKYNKLDEIYKKYRRIGVNLIKCISKMKSHHVFCKHKKTCLCIPLQ